jgi:hypothetical protein
MRVAFTIVLNGANQLRYNNFISNMAQVFDFWVIVEGAALPNGSTSWCRQVPDFNIDGASIDGTRTVLKNAEKSYGNVVVVYATKPWQSKDEQVNSALTVILNEIGLEDNTFLWQVDVDEQWTIEQVENAERELVAQKGDCGCFHCNYHVGKDLYAIGAWGQGNDPSDPLKYAYRRLWLWDGRPFEKHEPPVLEGGNGKEVLLTPLFEHYAYTDSATVRFKGLYYSGHEGIYEKWLKLQTEITFPQPISYLISGPWGKTATVIVKK